jgi:hypothetical protein
METPDPWVLTPSSDVVDASDPWVLTPSSDVEDASDPWALTPSSDDDADAWSAKLSSSSSSSATDSDSESNEIELDGVSVSSDGVRYFVLWVGCGCSVWLRKRFQIRICLHRQVLVPAGRLI